MRKQLSTLVFVLALIAAACSGDDDADSVVAAASDAAANASMSEPAAEPSLYFEATSRDRRVGSHAAAIPRAIGS